MWLLQTFQKNTFVPHFSFLFYVRYKNRSNCEKSWDISIFWKVCTNQNFKYVVRRRWTLLCTYNDLTGPRQWEKWPWRPPIKKKLPKKTGEMLLYAYIHNFVIRYTMLWDSIHMHPILTRFLVFWLVQTFQKILLSRLFRYFVTKSEIHIELLILLVLLSNTKVVL